MTKENTMTDVSMNDLYAIDGGARCYSISLEAFGIPIGISIGDCPMTGQ